MCQDREMDSGRNTKGLRCTVCTGCGLCPGVFRTERNTSGMHILADEIFRFPVEYQSTCKRLVVVDIGTTTIAMLLCSANGGVEDRYVCVNPQTRYGADVISRIQAAEKPGQAEEMRRLLLEVLRKGLDRFRQKLLPEEEMQIVLAGNTTMTYFLMGWNTVELGYAPFVATHLQSGRIAVDGVTGYVIPCMSAFVGGDIVAGILASGMMEQEGLTLLVDLGTNGEIVLGNREKRIACATAAGPAFEGGVNRGIWGADMVSLLARLRQEELLDAYGTLPDRYLEKGVRIGNVCVTGEAVRSIQLAKAAIAAGIDVVLEKMGVRANQVDRVVLAGGFGYYVKPEAARRIGLLSNQLVDKLAVGGNTALAGACLIGRLRLRKDGELSAEALLQNVTAGTTCINLAQETNFTECYLQHMQLSSYE